MKTHAQSWGSYFIKVIYYIIITSYFYQEVIYYSYILLHQKSNFVILLLLSKVIILCNLVTSYLKFTNEHVCRTLFLLRNQEFYI